MTSVIDYSQTAGSNTSVGGVNIVNGSMTPGTVDNAFRAVLSDIAKMYADAVTGVTTTGAANAYLLATNNVHTAYANTTAGRLRANFSNTAAATINVDGLGVKNIQKYDTTGLVALGANDIRSGGIYDWGYDVTAGVVVLLDPVQALISTFAKTFLDDANATAVLATLGIVLGTAATNVPQLTAAGKLPAVPGDLLTSSPAPGYDSGDQDITSGSTLTLTHGLGSKPSRVEYILVCRTAQSNYSVGNEIDAPLTSTDAGETKINTPKRNVTSNTQIVFQFDDSASCFSAANGTGVLLDLINASFKLIVRAWK